jgi:hypothetical protein
MGAANALQNGLKSYVPTTTTPTTTTLDPAAQSALARETARQESAANYDDWMKQVSPEQWAALQARYAGLS